MARAIINGTEFTARSYTPFINEGDFIDVILYIYTESIDAVIEAAGQVATIQVVEAGADDFYAADMKLERATMYWECGARACEARFVPFSITNAVRSNTEDIEIIAGAIEELAALIG